MIGREAEIGRTLPPRTIAWLTLSALVVALVVLFAAVLPAEFDRDPTGLGRLTGIAALWAPEEKVVAPAAIAPGGASPRAAPARSVAMPLRNDVVTIPLAAAGDPERGDEIEYKVHLKAGAGYVYSWSVAGTPDQEFYTEFHGHTIAKGQPMTVAYYRKATGTSDRGVLTAPFDGVHGWYFQNQSEKPVTVRLRLAGFYDLVPDGQPGNEAGLHAAPVGDR